MELGRLQCEQCLRDVSMLNAIYPITSQQQQVLGCNRSHIQSAHSTQEEAGIQYERGYKPTSAEFSQVLNTC
jgi:hypothetical protein